MPARRPLRRRQQSPSLVVAQRLDVHPCAFLELLDRVPPVRGRVGRPRRRPRTLIADRGYDHDKYRRLVWQRGVKTIIARRKTEHGSGLGRHRWVDDIELGPLGRLGTRRLAALQRRLKNGSPCATFGPWSPRFANTDVWR
jgi:transposase